MNIILLGAEALHCNSIFFYKRYSARKNPSCKLSERTGNNRYSITRDDYRRNIRTAYLLGHSNRMKADL